MARTKHIAKPFRDSRRARRSAAASGSSNPLSEPPVSTAPPLSAVDVASTAPPVFMIHYEESHAVVTSQTTPDEPPPVINPNPQSPPRVDDSGSFLNPLFGPHSPVGVFDLKQVEAESTIPELSPVNPPPSDDNPIIDDSAQHGKVVATSSPTSSDESPSGSVQATPSPPRTDKTRGKRPISPSDQEYTPEPELVRPKKRTRSTSVTKRKRKPASSSSAPAQKSRTRSAIKSPPPARYKAQLPSKLLMERDFDPVLIKTYPHIPRLLAAYKWEKAIPFPGTANATLLRELYSAIASAKDTTVVIRGRTVNFGPRALSNSFGMPVPPTCQFASILASLTVDTTREIAATLVMPQFLEKLDLSKLSIQSGQLTLEASLWFQFLRHNLLPAAHDATLSREKRVLLFCILKELPFDFGPVALSAIRYAASRSGSWLVFPILLTRLLSAARVPSWDKDEVCKSSSRIDQGTVQRIKRSGRFAAETHPQPSVQPSRDDAAKHHAASSSGYGSSDWLQSCPEFYFLVDPSKASTLPRFPPGLCPPQVIAPLAARNPRPPPTNVDQNTAEDGAAGSSAGVERGHVAPTLSPRWGAGQKLLG
ncbi:hypothetical protein L6452_31109 [Arctium lappa]|uniref:Uncharacterized protein n=1 Tax=Arctium lappa TaxID=4217 RepID=A0ACB8ZK01_ARCLA|nr:hypothetical protein L6452_31109 [Arctium lappa]